MIHTTVHPTPSRAAFRPPFVYTSAYPIITQAQATTVRGYLKRSDDPAAPVPPVDFSHLPRYSLTTTDGTLLVVPLYAMPYGADADRFADLKNATTYYAAHGEIAGWVEVGQDEDGVWVSGLVTTSNEKQRRAVAESTVKGDFRTDKNGQRYLAGVWARVPLWAVPSQAYGLTKGDLLKLLTEGEYADYPDDTPVVIAKDTEGENVSPLAGATEAMYWPDTWSGEIAPTNDQISASDHYTDDDAAPENAVRAIILDPKN